MDSLELQIAMDNIGQSLLKSGKTPEKIQELIEEESWRLKEELEDELKNEKFKN